jgi:hypothetical protein
MDCAPLRVLCTAGTCNHPRVKRNITRDVIENESANNIIKLNH